jgi:hypothetical protein
LGTAWGDLAEIVLFQLASRLPMAVDKFFRHRAACPIERIVAACRHRRRLATVVTHRQRSGAIDRLARRGDQLTPTTALRRARCMPGSSLGDLAG